MFRLLMFSLLGCFMSALSADDADIYQVVQEAWERGNHAAAVSLLKELAEQGNSGAQYRLGMIYLDGQGVPRKKRLAIAEEWFRRAAEQGHDEAQSKLGDIYYAGSWTGEVRQDLAAARKWHQLAAMQGHVKSQFRLGSLMCWQGDIVDGYAWLSTSARAGNKNALNERKRICRGMTPDQIEKAELLSTSLPVNPGGQ